MELEPEKGLELAKAIHHLQAGVLEPEQEQAIGHHRLARGRALAEDACDYDVYSSYDDDDHDHVGIQNALQSYEDDLQIQLRSLSQSYLCHPSLRNDGLQG